MFRKLLAEVFGTFWLVGAVLGSAMMAAGVPEVGIGWIGVAFAAGIAVLGAAYAVGGISGGHFNPAVTLGLAVSGRSPWSEVGPYWAAQLVGGILAAIVVFIVASGTAGFAAGTFAANGYDALSPGGYSLLSVLIIEIVLTAVFVIVILGSTSASAPAGFAPLAIGLTLTVVHLVGIPVSNASVNPARSIASAIFGGGEALGQVWLFIVAPLIGGALGGWIWKALLTPGESPAGIGQK